jgi:hypothetical protein
MITQPVCLAVLITISRVEKTLPDGKLNILPRTEPLRGKPKRFPLHIILISHPIKLYQFKE